ncbi:MAG: hypothetical protein CL524_10900 [Aequorivita sp.]|nr:hypothetical protein [Aequorivita sp.]|tara:strand:+ start:142 stop:546 length:405 start_codon:yes stop_codon:yes gene_type:complete
MSDNRNIISSENWVELYATLSNYILEYSSLDPIWIIDEDGNEVRTEEKQDEFIDIVDQVEAIMETVLIKESDPDDFTYTGGDSALLPDETGEREIKEILELINYALENPNEQVNTHGLAWQLIELTRPEEASDE